MRDGSLNGETPVEASAQIQSLTQRVRELEGQLAAAERLHESWLSIVSHDLRGPLTLVLGYGENLLRSARASREASKSIHDLEAVVGAARRLNKMVTQVVEGARLQGMKFVLNARPIDPSPILRESARASFKLYPSHSLRSDVPESLPLVDCDPYAVQSVVCALLSNAALFSPPEAPITLTARVDRGQVVVSIADKGLGLSDEERCHVFEPRYRPDRARNARREGLGFSLWIAREMARLSGGTVEVHSDGPNQGTIVTFALPVVNNQESQSGRPTPKE